MGKRSRTKGASAEREAAAFLTEHGFPARRGRQYSGGPGTPDISAAGQVTKSPLPGWHCEVKRVERFQLYPALEQATEDADEGERPLVIHRKNRQEWVAVLRLEDFLWLLRADWRDKLTSEEWKRMTEDDPRGGDQ